MKINNLELNNFGSYEGKNIFDFYTTEEQNIILIGGKNGAGKTTLFNAIRLAIYGYRAFGYQNINSYYNKTIIKLINNNAKLIEPTNAHIKIELDINNGQSFDHYNIKRKWTLIKKTVEEKTIIYKNNKLLKNDEIADFEKYIMQIIPPDLFDLYFFDGENIANFFLEEGNKIRLKNAFLTLCGYDIFEIMDKNFRRILSTSTQNNIIISTFLDLKEQIDKNSNEINNLKNKIIQNYADLDVIESQIKHLDEIYKKQGGVTKKEWDKKFQSLKDEERYREDQNAQLKKAANEIIPFLILKDMLYKLKNIVDKENESKKYEAFSEVLKTSNIINIFKDKIRTSFNIEKTLTEISKTVSKDYSENILLDLSTEQCGLIQYQIKRILEYNPQDIIKCINNIKDSIKKSQLVREEIDKSNIDKIDDYANQKSKYLDEKSKLLNLSIKLGNDLQILESKFAVINADYLRAKKNYENELKKTSINDISAKAIIMLEELQTKLYMEQIQKVENTFKKEINKLMRKEDFISEIHIDQNFNIKVYRKTKYSLKEINNIVNNIKLDGVMETLGIKAYNTIKEVIDKRLSDNEYYIDVELDTMSFSKGEKQIFIMALYKSLMGLCNNEVPFVIDTPFARIDEEHRNNIAKHFFRSLKGQVFILSTNKEIENKQLEMLKDKLSMTYMLKNNDNQKTLINKNLYFAGE